MAKQKTKSSFSRAGIGFGVVVQSLCVIFLVLAANYVGFNYYKRWDFSRSQKFTLAEQTKQALRQFEGPVKITMVFSPSTLSVEGAIYGDVQNLLRELEFSGREAVRVEEVDPTRDPAKASELASKYGFDARENVLVLAYGEQTKVIPIAELGDFDFSGVPLGNAPELRGFNGESVLTAAFIELLNPEKARIYFLQGHGEPPASRLTMLLDYIDRQNVESMGLNLAGVPGIPADAGAVCIIGARYDLTDAEAKVLRDYWEKNGRLVILLDPEADTPRLRGLVEDACIIPHDDRVLALQADPVSPGKYYVLTPVRGVFLSDPAITKRLVTTNAYLPGPAQSLGLDGVKAADEDVQVRPLIQAAEPYWGETDYASISSTSGPQYQDGKDIGQPVVVAASAEKGGTSDEKLDVASSRMVVVGDAGFANDETVQQAPGNLDFMVSVINRLLERSKLTGIAPRTVNTFSLSLTDDELRHIALYTLVVLPGAAALLGLIVGFRRRA